ncbi:MAG: hypothetical protein J7J79_02990 [Thermoplasmata archaeon]|nr:hypothetical protein [Thermoplasmata archaeon]
MYYTFKNSKLYKKGILFGEKAILGVGITGDMFTGYFLKEERMGKAPWKLAGPEIILAAFVPYMYRVGSGWIPHFYEMMDDDLFDGEGMLELYLNYSLNNKILVAGKSGAATHEDLVFREEGRKP